jgi:phosphopentomutase
LSVKLGGLTLPHLQGLGIGHLTTILGVPPVAAPTGAYGKMRETSNGKDTTTGHWEMTGLQVDKGFPTFPHGFPSEMMERFSQLIGRGFLGNKPASGTEIIEELGVEHLKTKSPIVYTSADSVFQVAAHEEVIPLPELYRICEIARKLCDEIPIARVIARPFVGEPGHFKRTYNRRDFSMPPPTATILDSVADAGMPVIGVGKIWDIFAGRGVTQNIHSEGNADGLVHTLEALEKLDRGMLFVNLVDFDMLYGHRNDAPGFARALAELDAWLPTFEATLRPGDVVFITADHGNDPTTPGTDHTRERVPLLAFGPAVHPAPLGTRASFCDLGQTIAAALGIPPIARGTSFLDAIVG